MPFFLSTKNLIQWIKEIQVIWHFQKYRVSSLDSIEALIINYFYLFLMSMKQFGIKKLINWMVKIQKETWQWYLEQQRSQGFKASPFGDIFILVVE